jgi:superfamily II DNA/RNA helicase
MASVAIDGKDSVIRSPTGSGKTLAYLMPLLSGISNELLDEDVKGYLNNFMAGGAPRVGDDTEESLLKLPLGVIVVPSKELGVQVSLTLHQVGWLVECTVHTPVHTNRGRE